MAGEPVYQSVVQLVYILQVTLTPPCTMAWHVVVAWPRRAGRERRTASHVLKAQSCPMRAEQPFNTWCAVPIADKPTRVMN